jgi:hypothetical protein
MFTPCGLSMKEIKALENFPDYTKFSGVPLPKPYPKFNIRKALPRPYRPIRWGYHQTMCTCYRRKSPQYALTPGSFDENGG